MDSDCGDDEVDQEEVLANIKIDAENETNKFLFGEMLEIVAITVLAGHHWATNRNFDDFFDAALYASDREYAKQQLEHFYDKKNLNETIQEMINRQAHTISLRRKKDGIGDHPDDYCKDRWEAKRFVAFLFFEEILKGCIEKCKCPIVGDDNILSGEIIELLKSLSIEEYCRIKGYLFYLSDQHSNSENYIHGNDAKHYFKAMDLLDKAFLNCKGEKNKTCCSSMSELILDDHSKIKKAKQNPSDRLGYIDSDSVKSFVEKYYSLIEKIFSGKKAAHDPISVLHDLYNKDNSKIINMVEFMLKCMIASHVEDDAHWKIRVNSGKHDITESTTNKRCPKEAKKQDPLGYPLLNQLA